MPMEGIVIVRTGGEIGIKSRPVRRIYENRLVHTVREVLRGCGIPFSRIWRIAGRIYISSGEADLAAERAAKVFGISSTSPGVATSSGIHDIVSAGVEIAKTFRPGTFAVKSRRTGDHPFTSQELSAALGEAILKRGQGLKVDLSSPQQTLNVEVRGQTAILYTKVLRGPDGFPLGTQDPFIGIIDGTPDSVIASWCMMRRGAPLTALAVRGAGDGGDGGSSRCAGGGGVGSLRRNLRILSAWMSGRSLKCTVIDGDGNGADSVLPLYVAATLAERTGIGVAVSGLRPKSLEAVVRISKRLPGIVFPLIAMDEEIIGRWAGMIGIGQKLSCGEPVGRAFSEEDVRRILSRSEEITVRAGEEPDL